MHSDRKARKSPRGESRGADDRARVNHETEGPQQGPEAQHGRPNPSRERPTRSGMTDVFTDDELGRLEREHAEGLTSEQIVDLFTRRNVKFTEATLRKYVQLGLLPRSRRVAIGGGQRGSQGLYPASVVRRIQRLKAMLAHHSIEEIQREFLFVRGDLEELEGALERVFSALAAAAGGETQEALSRAVHKELTEARSLAADLMGKLSSVETRLTMRARLAKQARKEAV